MSTGEVIARLEALLARVRTRAAEPRRLRAVAPASVIVAAPAAPIAASPVVPAPAAFAAPAAYAAPAAAPAPAQPPSSDHPSIVDDDEASEWPTRPPPPLVAKEIEAKEIEAKAIAAKENEAAAVDGVERQAPVLVGPPVEEVVAEKAFESRERLVAAEPVAPEELAAPEEPTASDDLIAPEKRDGVAVAASAAAYAPTDASAPELEAVVIEDAASNEVIADEVVEDVAEPDVESPASSRRPVAPEPEERIAQIAFGAEEPRAPLHTPPPESGRLPAATVDDFDADVTGVRDAAPMPSRRPPEVVLSPAEEPLADAAGLEDSIGEERTREIVESGPKAASPAAVLSPEATHPDLPASDAVAEAIGEAQRFAPGTFVALLEASLAL